jgi:hypothetical protein
MRKSALLALKLGGLLLAVTVALPLGSWAAARVPIAARVSFVSSCRGSTASVLCAHRRVRRQRRDSSAYHGNWSRALTASMTVSQSLHSIRPEDIPLQRAVVDLPPPDLPPA